jgi:hypothetical protein
MAPKFKLPNTSAAAEESDQPFFVAKLQQQIDSDATKIPAAAAGTLAASAVTAPNATTTTTATVLD